MKKYKVVSGKYLEHLVDELNKDEHDGWSVEAYTQEFGVTKVLLSKETKTG